MESSYHRETLSFLRKQESRGMKLSSRKEFNKFNMLWNLHIIEKPCHSCESRNPEVCSQKEIWIPAFARMTYIPGYSYYGRFMSNSG